MIYVIIKDSPSLQRHLTFFDDPAKLAEEAESLRDRVVVLEDDAFDDLDIDSIIEIVEASQTKTVAELIGQ